jgi:hypothetical protein
MLQPPKEEALAFISNASRKGMALSCLHLLLPTRMNENPTKTQKL